MLPIEKKSIKYLTSQFSQSGKVVFISIRPTRGEIPLQLESVRAIENIGLEGDHYASKGGKRQVTLIAQEHLNAVASIMSEDKIDPLLLRRNIVISGLNLQGLKENQFRLGEAILEYTGECHPCSRMEENLGTGGYNAMRGHGGITARILQGGIIKVGDELVPLD